MVYYSIVYYILYYTDDVYICTCANIVGWLNAFKEGGWLPSWASPGYRNCMVLLRMLYTLTARVAYYIIFNTIHILTPKTYHIPLDKLYMRTTPIHIYTLYRSVPTLTWSYLMPS